MVPRPFRPPCSGGPGRASRAFAFSGGAFTNEQLRTIKREGSAKAEAIRGRFDWMRRDLLAVVGGNFYHRCPVILQLGNRPVDPRLCRRLNPHPN